MVDLNSVKDRIDEVVERHAEALIEASHQVHAHPELGFQEHHAHDVLSKVLEGAGLAVTRRARGVDTAFEARVGSEGPVVAVLCEYDALPGLGHACGHNVIGAAGVGAGIAAATVAEELGGTVVVLGTPAEEGGGGKVKLALQGAFDDVDAALMVHPAGIESTRIEAIAIQRLNVTYTGAASHAAAAPQLGRNALDAAVLGYVNVAALRQHIRPDERIHGIFTDGGQAPNVVPERAAASWYVRSPTTRGLELLKLRVMACLEAGTAAAGCSMEVEWVEPAFANMVDNEPMLRAYAANLARTGRTVTEPKPGQGIVGSTDMGNVSHVVPSIHPMIAVAEPDVAIHTAAFERCAGGPRGDQAVLDGARTLAATVVDLWAAPGIMEATRAAFAEARASGLASGSVTL